MIRKLASPHKAWPLHRESRKDLAYIKTKNRLQEVPVEERSFKDARPIPLKRKYLVFRSYMQSPVGSPQQTGTKRRPYFPTSRIRAIKSSLA